jgi:hypothetical protein
MLTSGDRLTLAAGAPPGGWIADRLGVPLALSPKLKGRLSSQLG